MNGRRKSSLKVVDVTTNAHTQFTETTRGGRYFGHRRAESSGIEHDIAEEWEDEVPPELPTPTTTTTRSSGRILTHRRTKSSQMPPSIDEAGQEDIPSVPQLGPLHEIGLASTRDGRAGDHADFPGKFDPNELMEKYSHDDGSFDTIEKEKEDAIDPLQRSSKRRTLMQAVIPASTQQTIRNATNKLRKSSIYEVYENAKKKTAEVERKRWAQLLFEYSVYFLLLAFVYFVIIGMPLWNGIIYWTYIIIKNKLVMSAGWVITVGIAAL
jgi:hypothetical protein